MRMNFKTENFAVEIEIEPEEFAEMMEFRKAMFNNSEFTKKYLENMMSVLKEIVDLDKKSTYHHEDIRP